MTKIGIKPYLIFTETGIIGKYIPSQGNGVEYGPKVYLKKLKILYLNNFIIKW